MQLNKKQELTLTALGNGVRRDIVQMLAQNSMSVGEIAARIPVSRPAISKHLKLLKNANLIKAESMGTRNIYRLERQGFEDAKNWLDGFWDDALARLKMVAENSTPKNMDVDQ